MKITYKFLDGNSDISFDLDKNCVLFGANGSGKTRILKTLVEISDFKLRVDTLPEILSKYNIERLQIDNYNLNSESDNAIIDIQKSDHKFADEFISKNIFAFRDLENIFDNIIKYNRDTPFFPTSSFKRQRYRIHIIIQKSEKYKTIDKNREIKIFIQSSKRLLRDVEKNIELLNINNDIDDLVQIIQEANSIINFIERRYEDYKFSENVIEEKQNESRIANDKLQNMGIKNNAKYISTGLEELDEIILEVENTFNKIKTQVGNEYLSILFKQSLEFDRLKSFQSKKLMDLQRKLINNKIKIDNLNNELIHFGNLKIELIENKIVVKKNNEKLAIEILSSGEKRLLALLLNVSFSNENFLLIDEPEISLSLHVQSKIVFTLKSIAEILNKKLIIATHAPYVYESCDKSDFELVRLF
ncbi:AAA family ATPase [Lactococcus lactis]|uniref:AAA family ATPase n=1 Tax=Lactococcus lactis TaxID=1358 RepID=UPI000C9FCE50|nr:AAA family ATPase [Lactococcus lactis]AUS69642.1 hypothetical protein LLG50_06000 [Lactococcus lactis subsp. lactis]